MSIWRRGPREEQHDMEFVAEATRQAEESQTQQITVILEMQELLDSDIRQFGEPLEGR